MGTINVGFRGHKSTRDTDKNTQTNNHPPSSLEVVSHTHTQTLILTKSEGSEVINETFLCNLDYLL